MGFLKLIAVTALLASATLARADSACESAIKSMGEMQTHFMSRSGLDDLQSGQSSEETMAAVQFIEDVDKVPKKDSCRLKAWRAYVNLTQAIAPYDKDFSSMQSIASDLKSDPSLRPAYEDAIKKFSDKCRSRFVAAQVRQLECMTSTDDIGKQDKCVKASKRDKDFVACARKATKSN